MGITYHVGVPHGAVSIENLSDVVEVLDHIHTLLMDATGLAAEEKDELVRAVESVLERAENMADETVEQN